MSRPEISEGTGQTKAGKALDVGLGEAEDRREAPDGLQPRPAAQETALSEAEDAQDVPSLSHVKSVTVGTSDGRRVTYAPSLILAGPRLDRRTTAARIEKRRCDQIARDKGFRDFADAPGALQGEIAGYVRLWMISDLLWAGYLSGDRLMFEAFLNCEQAKTRKAAHIGLKRELRDARAIDLGTYLHETYGRNGERPETPARLPDPPPRGDHDIVSIPGQRATEASEKAGEDETP